MKNISLKIGILSVFVTLGSTSVLAQDFQPRGSHYLQFTRDPVNYEFIDEAPCDFTIEKFQGGILVGPTGAISPTLDISGSLLDKLYAGNLERRKFNQAEEATTILANEHWVSSKNGPKYLHVIIESKIPKNPNVKVTEVLLDKATREFIGYYGLFKKTPNTPASLGRYCHPTNKQAKENFMTDGILSLYADQSEADFPSDLIDSKL